MFFLCDHVEKVEERKQRRESTFLSSFNSENVRDKDVYMKLYFFPRVREKQTCFTDKTAPFSVFCNVT